jgi:hypothetical protein
VLILSVLGFLLGMKYMVPDEKESSMSGGSDDIDFRMGEHSSLVVGGGG